MKKVCIVIVNYNGIAYQNEALESLFAMKEQDFDIVIVDNASSDASVSFAKSRWSQLIVLQQTENVGFAKGCNIGINYSIEQSYEYTLLINNDIVASPDLLSELLQYANADTITVPKIYYYNPRDVLWYTGGIINWDKLETRNRGYGEIDQGQYDEMEETAFLNGCCMLIHNSIFEQVGKFDEKMFMYFEDTDLGIRAQEAGKKILYVPKAMIWHKVSSSTGGEDSKYQVYYMNRNRLYFAQKYRSKIGVGATAYSHIKAFAKWALSLVYKRNNCFIAIAYRDYYKGKMGKKDL